MKEKSMKAFITEHRDEIDQVIRKVLSYKNKDFKIDDRERRLWILNDEGLYNWARSEGVKI